MTTTTPTYTNGEIPPPACAVAVHVALVPAAVTVIVVESPAAAVLGMVMLSPMVLEAPPANVILGGVTERVGPQLLVSEASRSNVAVAVPVFVKVTENWSRSPGLPNLFSEIVTCTPPEILTQRAVQLALPLTELFV